MSTVGAIADRADRPAIVRFERVAVEDKEQSILQGKFIAKDVDYALITPPYSKDVIRIKVTQWLANMQMDMNNDRLPAEWFEKYKESYKRWQNGQEMPADGTPIRGWGVLSPAQQQNLIALNIMTVEDLAGVNGEGLQRIGMGARDLQVKAMTWLRTLKDRGPLTQEMAALKQKNAEQATTIDNLMRQVNELTARMNNGPQPGPAVAATDSIRADDILPENEPVPLRRRK